MIAVAGPAAYDTARRMIAQGVRLEDAARRTGFGVEPLRTLVERDRAADLRAWQRLGGAPVESGVR